MRNKVKEVLERKLGEPVSSYKLRKLTGLGRGTCLSALNDPNWYPDQGTSEKLCKVFELQPGDFLFYEPEENSANLQS